MDGQLDTRTKKQRGRDALVRVAIGVVVGGAVFGGVVRYVGGAQEDSATGAMAVAAISLCYCLYALYRIVHAVAQTDAEIQMNTELGIAVASGRDLRDERRRLLKAINELKFDFQMGKLSERDYKDVRENYELRAVDVMRALETQPTLHAELACELEEMGIVLRPKPEAEAEADADAQEAVAEPDAQAESALESGSDPQAEVTP